MKLDFTELIQLGCPEELATLIIELDTPEKTQEYLNRLKYNYERRGETARSIVEVWKKQMAHCFEGTIFAYTVLWIHDKDPEIVAINAVYDLDHNLVVYREGNKWGSVAQSRHNELKGKPPQFNSIRDLVMSYYDDYTSDWPGYNGFFSMFGYSDPIDLVKKFGKERFLRMVFARNDDAVWKIYNNYTRGVLCTPINERRGRYPYPDEE